MVRKKQTAPIKELAFVARGDQQLALKVARDTKMVDVLIQTCDMVAQMVAHFKEIDKKSYSIQGLKDQLLSLNPALEAILMSYGEWVYTFEDVASLVEQYADIHNTDLDSNVVADYYFTLITTILANIKGNLEYAKEFDPKDYNKEQNNRQLLEEYGELE